MGRTHSAVRFVTEKKLMAPAKGARERFLSLKDPGNTSVRYGWIQVLGQCCRDPFSIASPFGSAFLSVLALFFFRQRGKEVRCSPRCQISSHSCQQKREVSWSCLSPARPGPRAQPCGQGRAQSPGVRPGTCIRPVVRRRGQPCPHLADGSAEGRGSEVKYGNFREVAIFVPPVLHGACVYQT